MVDFTVEEAMKVQRGSGVIAPHFY